MVYPSWAAASLAPWSAFVKKGSLVCLGIRTMTFDLLVVDPDDVEPPVPVLHAASAASARIPTA